MTAIYEKDVDYAVVARMREMLKKGYNEYEVTHTYSLFAVILLWVMQRARDKNSGLMIKDLCRQSKGTSHDLKSDPWNLSLSELNSQNSDFQGHDAARLMKNLRDAVAHGDSRKVTPYNNGETLLGFTFKCEEKGPNSANGKREVSWQGQIKLRKEDMLQIGDALATWYCDELKKHRPGISDSSKSITEQHG